MNFKDYFKKENIEKQIKGKGVKIGGYSALVSVIVIAIAVFVVMTFDSLNANYTKLDMTKENMMSLSDASVNVVKAVDKDINIFMIAQNGTEDNYVKNMVEKYAGYNDKIHFEIKDPVIYPNFAKEYTSLKITNNSLIVNCGDKSRYISNDEIYKSEVDYSTYQEKVEFDGENQLTRAIDYVTNENLPKVYMTSGHGENQLMPDFENAVKNQSFATEEISLVTAAQIPDDAGCVFINDPKTDISVNEKDLLLSYLENGGKLILLSGYNGEELPVLNELMSAYGMIGENKLVVEGDGGMSVAGHNNFIVPEMNSANITDPLIEKKYAVLLPMAHPIKEVETDATVKSLLVTSDNAYTKSDAINSQILEKEDGDVSGKYNLAMTSTKETENGKAEILWISSAYFLDQNMNKIVSGGNMDLFLNALGWLCEKEETIAIHAKSLDGEYLNVSSTATTLWSIIFIFLIPVLFIILGIYIKFRRKNN